MSIRALNVWLLLIVGPALWCAVYAYSAYELLPKGEVGVLPDLVRQEVLSCRRALARYCDDNPRVLDVYERLLLTMAYDGAFEEGLGEWGTLLEAIEYAAHQHRTQVRKDRERSPYIIHPLGVALLLWVEADVRDPPLLTAAVLHDTVEDCAATHEELVDRFGPHVAGIVAEVTDDKSLAWEERKRYQILHAPHLSYEAKLLKLADQLYNVRDAEHGAVIVWVGDRAYPWSDERVDAYLLWAQAVCEGLKGTSPRLEAALEELFEAGRAC
ncbi:MAG: HD domain-containing protein [Parachlamydiales bacterium]